MYPFHSQAQGNCRPRSSQIQQAQSNPDRGQESQCIVFFQNRAAGGVPRPPRACGLLAPYYNRHLPLWRTKREQRPEREDSACFAISKAHSRIRPQCLYWDGPRGLLLSRCRCSWKKDAGYNKPSSGRAVSPGTSPIESRIPLHTPRIPILSAPSQARLH
jgi:hypothetical protein